VKWGSDQGKRRAVFKLTMPVGREDESDNIQTWQFYYDKDGKELERYPHALFFEKAKPEQALGESGDRIPKGTASVECEVSRISFRNKTFWFNANLEQNMNKRPRGGYTNLAELTGERLHVDVIDAKKAHVRLRNVSQREIKKADIELIYFKADGDHDTKLTWNVEVALKPGATAERDLAVTDAPAEFKSIEGSAPKVVFSDDSEWENRNLSGYALPR
jgi:hypothetical protein